MEPFPSPSDTVHRLETELTTALSDLEKIDDIVTKEEERSRSYRFSGAPSERVRHLFALLQHRNEEIVGGVKAFNQDLIVYLRAIGLVAEMVMNAGTHAEKNARMRGMIEQIETAIQKLRDHDMQFTDRHYWNAPDVWQSDYPVRLYMDRAHQAEQKLKTLEAELAVIKGEPSPSTISELAQNDELPL